MRWHCGVCWYIYALGSGSGELLVVYDDGGLYSLLCIAAGNAYSTLLGAIPTATGTALAVAEGTADAVPAAARPSRCSSTGCTSIGLTGGNIAIKQVKDFGAAVGGRDADVRDALADANSTGQPYGRCATDAYNAVPVGDSLDGVVDDLGLDVDDGRVENVRIEIGNQSLDVAGDGDAGRAGDDERRGQMQAAKLGG